MDLSKKVFHSIVKSSLIKASDTVIVGVSGGADSVTLLHVLYQLRMPLGIHLHVAHFNHRLRMGADKDEAFVKELALKLHLPFSAARRQGILKSKIVSEDKARQMRFKFFQELARQTKAKSIALAHTQNDLAETVLMRLIRGAGLLGLRGILSEHQMDGTRFIRPLLGIQRKEIEQYLKENHLSYCVDKTNLQTHYLRNKIRLQLLPALIKEYNVNFPNVLVDLAYTSQADYDYLLTQAKELFKDRVMASKGKVKINLNFFLKQHLSMQRMLLRLAFEHLAGDFNQLGFAHMQEVEDMIQRGANPSVVHWPKSIEILRIKDGLIIRTKA